MKNIKILITIFTVIVFSGTSMAHVPVPPMPVQPVVKEASLATELLELHKVVTKPIGIVTKITGLNKLLSLTSRKDIEETIPEGSLLEVREALEPKLQEITAIVNGVRENFKSEDAHLLMDAKLQYTEGALSYDAYLRILLKKVAEEKIEVNSLLNPEALLTQENIDWDTIFKETDLLYYELLKKSAVGLFEKLLVKALRDFDLIESIVYETALPHEMENYFDGEEFERLEKLVGKINSIYRKGKEDFSVLQIKGLLLAAKSHYNENILMANFQNRINQISFV